jgi:hypothetical protein
MDRFSSDQMPSAGLSSGAVALGPAGRLPVAPQRGRLDVLGVEAAG